MAGLIICTFHGKALPLPLDCKRSATSCNKTWKRTTKQYLIMKHLIKTTLLLLAVLLPTPTLAYQFSVNGIYYNINGNTATVTSSSPSGNYSGLVTIPATVTYNGRTYKVTSIDEWAFYKCTRLTNINIPNSITTIGNKAFYICSRLTAIDIPNSVTTIGDDLFYKCDSLKSITVASGNPKYDSRDNCNAIIETASNTLIASCKNSVIPNSVTSIGNYAFSGCPSLTTIDIPNSVTSIGNGAFSNCSRLTGIDIPNSVTSIGNGAFENCDSLTSINIPNSVTSIGNGAFNGTAWEKNQPNGLVYAGLVAYIYKGTIPEGTIITLKEGTIGIAGGAFYGSLGLTTINIPNSVTTIGNCAFIDCTRLTTVNIGNSVTFIGDGAFFRCSSLNKIYCYATTPPNCFYNDYTTFSNYSATLHVPAASLAAYFTDPEWSKFENIVGDAITPTGITISKDSVDMPLGEEIELIATITPANASYKEVTWYSTDTNVATVDNGIVTAVDYGECDIIAYCMGMPAICHITVTNRISLGQQEAMLLPNHMLTLTPSAPAMPSGFTATSSDPTVAAVRMMNSKVQVVGIKEGTTTITVASTDGTAQPATCLVTVYTELGDANCDGFVTITDVTGLIDYLLGRETTSIKVANADLNGDGHISIADATTLIDQLLTTDN